MMKWAQFANTIKLRLLIRLSNKKSTEDITAEIAKIDANKAGYITTDVNGQPSYSKDKSKQNSFYGYLARNSNNETLNHYKYTVASEFAIGLLELNNDNRIKKLFTPLDSTRYAIPIIATTDVSDSIVWYSKFKYKGAPQKTKFLLSGFKSNNLYHVGGGLLKTSYVHLGVRNGSLVSNPIELAEKYYTQPGVINVNLNDSPDKTEAIITQKWVALLGSNGIET